MRGGPLLALALVCGACDAEPRGQALIWIDTDLPVPEMVDTIRVDLLGGGGGRTAVATRVQVLPDRADWPVSFGVRPAPGGGPVRVRVRIYPSTRVAGLIPGRVVDPLDADEPLPQFTLDATLTVTPPEAGIEQIGWLLPGSCLGQTGTSGCGAVAVEIGGDAPPPTRAGTWPDAAPVPCTGEPRADSGLRDGERCIPGGVFFFGDELRAIDVCGTDCSFAPEQLVKISPFFMDEHEVSVGRFRAALERGFLPDGPYETTATPGCNFAVDEIRDEMPMNCVSWSVAVSFCRFDGGRLLPSEPQWEFAASGRGEERTYPWGEALAGCDDVAYARAYDPALPPEVRIVGTNNECSRDLAHERTEPVGSSPFDVSRDGVHDLGGNVAEWTRDELQAYGVGCWAGVRQDPDCPVGASAGFFAYRGSSFVGSAASMASVSRLGLSGDSGGRVKFGEPFEGRQTGFRCVRPD